MPFEPRLLAAEESSAENEESALPEDFELPGDLRELGAQLQSEARELARQFPSCTRQGDAEMPAAQVADHGPRQGRPAPDPRWIAAAGSLLAAAMLLAAVIVSHRDDRSGPLRPAARPAPAAWNDSASLGGRAIKPLSPGPLSPGSLFPGPLSQEDGDPLAPKDAGTLPVLFLQDLSGPELEGLLDLLEDEGRSCDISI